MPETMLNYVRRQLDAEKARWDDIQEVTKISRRTFEKLIYEPERDPRHSTVEALYQYFKSLEPA